MLSYTIFCTGLEHPRFPTDTERQLNFGQSKVIRGFLTVQGVRAP